MNEFFKKILDTVKNIWTKLSMVQKLIGGGVIVAAIVILVVIIILNSSKSGVPLFTEKLDIDDYAAVTKKLQDEGVKFTTKGNSIIIVKDTSTKNAAIMMLAQEGSMPKGKYNFLDIIKDKKLTSSKFENSIKIRAAVEGKLEELLRSSELIDEADVIFTVPEYTLFERKKESVKVAVVLTPSWKSELRENKKAIKGIEELVINSIEGAKKEHVVITDTNGIKLNDFTDEEELTAIMMTKKNLEIRDELVMDYREKIKKALTNLYTDDRISVMVDVQMDFDKEKEKRNEILPFVIKKDNPETPYDDSVVKDSVVESEKTTNEKFVGPGWIPEGPPGFDDNVPPGYKGALEQITEYTKDEMIKNYDYGKLEKEISKDPWEINKITASVTIDGTWKIQYDEKKKPVLEPDGSRKRVYTPVSDDELKKIKDSVEQGIGFSIIRGDKVVVNSLAKDRASQFAMEDRKWRRQKQTFYALFAGLIALIVLIISLILYRIIAKELERRKRLREEELARQHQLAREMALKSAEEEGSEIEMSLEDKTRLEMQENAMNLAREHPEDVAQLIRTWLQEE